VGTTALREGNGKTGTRNCNYGTSRRRSLPGKNNSEGRDGQNRSLPFLVGRSVSINSVNGKIREEKRSGA